MIQIDALHLPLLAAEVNNIRSGLQVLLDQLDDLEMELKTELSGNLCESVSNLEDDLKAIQDDIETKPFHSSQDDYQANAQSLVAIEENDPLTLPYHDAVKAAGEIDTDQIL
jgi:hypothetical protein